MFKRGLSRTQAFASGCRARAWACVIVAALTTLGCSAAPPPPDLAAPGVMQSVDFHNQWARGDMIVLVRHVERCDRSKNPCLEGSSGITVPGKAVALELGNAFRQLGLERTDIYNSPIKRAAQTALLAFGSKAVEQNWLDTCKTSMLPQVLEHKRKQRNLVMVSHSECINRLEVEMKLPDSVKLGYGTALFMLMAEGDQAPHIIGYLDAADWPAVLAH